MEKEVYIEHLLGVHLIMVTCWSDPSMIGWDSSLHSWFFVSSTLKRLSGTGYSPSGQPPSQTCHWNARLVHSFQGKLSLHLSMSWSIGNKSVKSRKNKNFTMHSFGPPGSFVQYADAALSPLRHVVCVNPPNLRACHLAPAQESKPYKNIRSMRHFPKLSRLTGTLLWYCLLMLESRCCDRQWVFRHLLTQKRGQRLAAQPDPLQQKWRNQQPWCHHSSDKQRLPVKFFNKSLLQKLCCTHQLLKLFDKGLHPCHWLPHVNCPHGKVPDSSWRRCNSAFCSSTSKPPIPTLYSFIISRFHWSWVTGEGKDWLAALMDRMMGRHTINLLLVNWCIPAPELIVGVGLSWQLSAKTCSKHDITRLAMPFVCQLHHLLIHSMPECINLLNLFFGKPPCSLVRMQGLQICINIHSIIFNTLALMSSLLTNWIDICCNVSTISPLSFVSFCQMQCWGALIELAVTLWEDWVQHHTVGKVSVVLLIFLFSIWCQFTPWPPIGSILIFNSPITTIVAARRGVPPILVFVVQTGCSCLSMCCSLCLLLVTLCLSWSAMPRRQWSPLAHLLVVHFSDAVCCRRGAWEGGYSWVVPPTLIIGEGDVIECTLALLPVSTLILTDVFVLFQVLG